MLERTKKTHLASKADLHNLNPALFTPRQTGNFHFLHFSRMQKRHDVETLEINVKALRDIMRLHFSNPSCKFPLTTSGFLMYCNKTKVWTIRLD